MNDAVRSIAVACLFALLSAPPIIQRLIGGDTRAFVVTTVLFVLGAAAFVSLSEVDGLDARTATTTMRYPRRATVVLVAAIVGATLFVICGRWLQQIFTASIDAFAADMLVVIREGLRRAAQGRNPYTIYHVPWAAPLPYGPLLWGPYVVPMLLRADLRFLTVAGELFVPLACAVVAAIAVARRGVFALVSCVVLLSAIGFDPSLYRFTTTAHTPVYWPLLALFAWFVVERRPRAAAIALGLLVVARSTMVALAPVLLMTVWQDDHGEFRQVLVRLLLAALLPFLPFALWDWRALEYGLYGSYEAVIKTVVWPDLTVPHTIGVTGILLSHHLQRWIETVQVIVMLAVYVASWFALHRRRAPIAVISFSLVAFSMTTLWPVYYVYFDPLLLMAAGIVAQILEPVSEWSSPAICRQGGIVCASSIGLVVVTSAAMLWWMPDGRTSIVVRDAPPIASVRVLRRTPIASAVVQIQFRAGYRVDARNIATTVNDVPFEAPIVEEDNGIAVAVPAALWQFGLNKLDVRFPSPVAVSDVALRLGQEHPIR